MFNSNNKAFFVASLSKIENNYMYMLIWKWKRLYCLKYKMNFRYFFV